jgi:hypothetical protein
MTSEPPISVNRRLSLSGVHIVDVSDEWGGNCDSRCQAIVDVETVKSGGRTVLRPESPNWQLAAVSPRVRAPVVTVDDRDEGIDSTVDCCPQCSYGN